MICLIKGILRCSLLLIWLDRLVSSTGRIELTWLVDILDWRTLNIFWIDWLYRLGLIKWLTLIKWSDQLDLLAGVKLTWSTDQLSWLTDFLTDIIRSLRLVYIIMRRSNCSAPIPPPGQPRGQRKNVCDKIGRGTGKLIKKGQVLENEGLKEID